MNKNYVLFVSYILSYKTFLELQDFDVNSLKQKMNIIKIKTKLIIINTNLEYFFSE